MQPYRGIKSFFLSVALLGSQISTGSEVKTDEREMRKMVLVSVTDQFNNYKNQSELESALNKALSKEDLEWLQSNPDYKNVLRETRISQKDESLIIQTKGAPEVSLSIVNRHSLTFKVNGISWQYRPYISLEKNLENLKATILSSESTSLLEKAFLLALPAEAHAVGFFAVIGVGVVVIVAATTLCGMVVRGSDSLACLMIPLAPVMAADALIDLAASVKKSVSEIGQKPLIYKDLQCTLDKKGNVQQAKLLFTEGSLQINMKEKGACKIRFDISDSKVKNTPYLYETDCDENGITMYTSNNQKDPPKEYTSSFHDNLNQTASLVDLCKDAERRQAFKEYMSTTSKLNSGSEVSEEKIKNVELLPAKNKTKSTTKNR